MRNSVYYKYPDNFILSDEAKRVSVSTRRGIMCLLEKNKTLYTSGVSHIMDKWINGRWYVDEEILVIANEVLNETQR